MLDWTKKGASSKSITIDNCDNAVREWSLHGRKVYNEYTTKLKPIAEKCLGHYLETPSFRYTLMQAVGYTPSWIAMHI